MHATGKSDEGVVSMKRANKGTQPIGGQLPAEFVEKRPSAKGNTGQTTVTGTQWLEGALSVFVQGTRSSEMGLKEVLQMTRNSHE
jgi:hypothetical protein